MANRYLLFIGVVSAICFTTAARAVECKPKWVDQKTLDAQTEITCGNTYYDFNADQKISEISLRVYPGPGHKTTSVTLTNLPEYLKWLRAYRLKSFWDDENLKKLIQEELHRKGFPAKQVFEQDAIVGFKTVDPVVMKAGGSVDEKPKTSSGRIGGGTAGGAFIPPYRPEPQAPKPAAPEPEVQK